jgi:hypothetical protein
VSLGSLPQFGAGAWPIAMDAMLACKPDLVNHPTSIAFGKRALNLDDTG